MAVSTHACTSTPVLATLVLSDDGPRRARIRNSLLGAVVYLIGSALKLVESGLGLVDRDQAVALVAGMLATAALFYLALRTHWCERAVDPSLTVQQIVAGLTWSAVSYAISGSQRQISLLVMQALFIFGIFNLKGPQVRWMWIYAVALMALTMGVMSQVRPQAYPWRIELIHFVLATTLMGIVGTLADRLGRMRATLKNQKRELETALERIHELATRDELTGLYNRRQMIELMDMHVKRARRTGQRFCVAVLDLDFFKRVNDTFGHSVGDEVLRGFAQQALTIVRETDVIARWGGEEFLIVLPETRAEHASMSLQRLKERLAACSVSAVIPELRASFSAGVAEYRDDETIGDTIERADRALYRAKDDGRNCVVVF